MGPFGVESFILTVPLSVITGAATLTSLFACVALLPAASAGASYVMV